MKTLIFTLIFSLQVFAAGDPGEMTRLTDNEISQKLVSVAQDVENQKILANTQELQPCRDAFQRDYDPKAGANATAVSALERCLSGKISPSDAERISNGLNLETYKLTTSKTVKDVTEYLTKNMYRQLTGVDLDQDRKERIRQQMFKNKKQIDQKMFFDLYKNQIAKNALYEVSRFCFEDFRSNDPSVAQKNNFLEHWDNLSAFDTSSSSSSLVGNVNDKSSPAFEPATGQGAPATPADPKDSYAQIATNIFGASGVPNDQKLTQRLGNFFLFCGGQINKLCEGYETKCKRQNGGLANCTGMDSGAKACIAKNRLIAYRNAMSASGKIMEEFDKNDGQDYTVLLSANAIVKRYQPGSNGDKSLNELTNNASANFFEATKNESTEQAENCIRSNGGNGNDCDAFSINSDAEEKIVMNTEIAYSAKREAELARIRELKTKGAQALEEYLDKNYPDLKEFKDNESILLEKITRRWDAKRLAIIQQFKDKIGDRQVTANEIKDNSSTDPNFKTTIAKKNAADSINEKTRLAQVVMFNNIISSSLNLQDKDKNFLGRNVQALNNELDTARQRGIDAPLFQNLQSLVGDAGSGGSGGGQSSSRDQSVESIEFLNDFIGIPKDQTGSQRSPGSN